jgi:hypothetical protein
MQDVFAFLQKGFKIGAVFLYVDLRSSGVCAGGHGIVEIVEGHGSAQIIQILYAVQFIMETDIGDGPAAEVLFRQVCGGTTAENIFVHRSTSFHFYLGLRSSVTLFP